MKVSNNFDIREFVSPRTWKAWGAKSIWFVDQRLINLAQFYKDFFREYYQAEHTNVMDVSIVINNWMWSGSKIGRGYREPEQYNSGQFSRNPNSESLHRQGKAFDCDVVLVLTNGKRVEVEQEELHQIIRDNWKQFKAAGLTTLESYQDATTWLHSDIRNTQSDELLIVGA